MQHSGSVPEIICRVLASMSPAMLLGFILVRSSSEEWMGPA